MDTTDDARTHSGPPPEAQPSSPPEAQPGSARLGPEQVDPSPAPRQVLVLGATGYIGGRLVPRLLQAGHRVRVAVRSPQKLAEVPWADDVEIHEVDLDDGVGLDEAMAGIEVLYHLVHSMGGGSDFEEHEAKMAHRIADSAAAAGVARAVFLGGLHPQSRELSPHMRSRARVGQTLLNSPVDTLAFQAGIIIGSGSASFEMIRHLALALPVMPAPDWVANHVEPIAVRDVLHYLVRAADVEGPVNRTLDLGSREVLTYTEVMRRFARLAGLRRRIVIPLPLPAATLSGIWVGLVTPLPMSLTLPLVRSLQEDAVTDDHDVDEVIAPPRQALLRYDEAVTLALRREAEGAIDTTWDADVGGLDHAAGALPSDPEWSGRPVYVDQRSAEVDGLSAAEVWPIVEGIGGRNGWYSMPTAWKIRGVWDKLVGGAGLNRGRRLPNQLRVGDPVDWWRVETLERGRRLVLRAEMRVSGEAWLEFLLEDEPGDCRYTQRAVFFPANTLGRAYWAAMAPFHRFIFPAMRKNIIAAARARRESGGTESSAENPEAQQPQEVWA